MSGQNKKSAERRVLLRLIFLLSVMLLILLSIAAYDLIPRIMEAIPNETTAPVVTTQPTQTLPTTQPVTVPATVETTAATTAPTEPYVIGTASVGVTGDVLIHKPVMNAVKTSSGEYDFSELFLYIQEYYEKFDWMVANLEVTLGGTEAGEYNGYPSFNCPDSIVDALKDAGVDMLLTANNHSYDTRYNGMMRTLSVLDEKDMDHIGTRTSEDIPYYTVKDLGGIKIGMICYTYDTATLTNGNKSLNGITLSEKARPLVSTFRYDQTDVFYDDVSAAMEAMKAEGAEAIMVYIHWGDEYHTTENANQRTIAQGLCELGVDVIVGGHPHVIQPFETLVSESGHETYCIYSLGNAVSNQRRSNISSAPKGHTEDGMIFGVSFQKWSDGTVEVGEISILPTWVNRYTVNGQYDYNIIPLDTAVEAWDSYSVNDTDYMTSSYERTMKIVGEGLNACREAMALETVPAEVE